MRRLLNRDLLPHNTCFGCGLENPDGLHIEVVEDPADSAVLRARFIPTERMVGFPGITHGGAIFTALDCLSTWVASLKGPNPKAAWVLRSANALFHAPAHSGRALALTGRIGERGGAWDPMTVRTEAKREDGTLCVEVDYKVVPLSVEKLKAIAGIEEIPEGWRAFLARS